MISVHIKVVLQRFLEILFTNIIISAFVVFLNISNILETDASLCGGLIVGLCVFMYINIRLLRQCYFELKNNGLYYFVNITAYLIFAGLSLGAYKYFPIEVYSFLFAIFKFLKYSRLTIDTLTSLVLGHTIGLLSIFLSPLGMKWVFVHALTED